MPQQARQLLAPVYGLFTGDRHRRSDAGEGFLGRIGPHKVSWPDLRQRQARCSYATFNLGDRRRETTAATAAFDTVKFAAVPPRPNGRVTKRSPGTY
jgi:hypothetical protein